MKETKMANEYHNEFMELISKISSNENVNDTLNDILKFSLNYYKADRAYIFDVDRLLSIGCNTHEVCAKGVTPQIDNLQNVPYELAPRWAETFSHGESIFLADVEDLKKDYYSEYELLKMQGIRSLIAVPYVKKGISGCIGVDNPKINSENDYMLQNLAYIIVLCLVEKQLGDSIIYSIKNEHIKSKNDIFVKTFGDFEINTFAKNFNTKNVTSKQCIELFIYLLLNRNETASIEKLTNIFWPNQEVLEPYNYIKNIAFRARKSFKNVSSEDIIVAENGSYSLNDNLNIITDYEIVDALYEESEKNVSSEILKIENYEKIIELYDNTMFNDLSTELWMMPVINKYKSIYIDVVSKLLEIYYSQKEYDKMLKITEKAIKINYSISNFHYYAILAYLGKKKLNVAESYLEECSDIITESEKLSIQNIIKDFNIKD